MKVWNLMPALEHIVYRPNIDPSIKKISNLAIAAFGTLAVLALGAFPAKIVVPLAIISSVAAWIFPLFFEFQPKPDFNSLREYGISEETVKQFQSDAEKGDFGHFEKFLKTLSDTAIQNIKEAHLFTMLSPILAKSVAEDKLFQTKDETAKKLLTSFRRLGVINQKDFKPDVVIIADDGTKFRFNQTVLDLSTPFFKTALKNFREGKVKEIQFPKQSRQLIESFLNFLLTGELNNDLGFVDLIHLIDFGRMSLIDDLLACATEHLTKAGSKCTKAHILEELLQFLSKCGTELPSLEEEIESELTVKAFTTFFASKYGSRAPFQYSESIFTLPVESLGLLNVDNTTGNYLKGNVNCLSLNGPLSDDALSRLETVCTLLSDEQKKKITALQIPASISHRSMAHIRTLHNLFPSLNRICLRFSEESADFTFLMDALAWLKTENIPEMAFSVGDFGGSNTRYCSMRKNLHSYAIHSYPSARDWEKLFQSVTHLDNFSERVIIPIAHVNEFDRMHWRETLERFLPILQTKIDPPPSGIVDAHSPDVAYGIFSLTW